MSQTNTDEKVSIKDIIRDLKLEVEYMPEDEDIYVLQQDLNRPGLQFAGYFEYFTPGRIQVVGKSEYNFFSSSDKSKRREILDEFFSYDIPAIIVSRGMIVNEDVIEFAKKYKRPVLTSTRNTTRLINKLSNYLDDRLAPNTTIHGVLVDVYGIGVLIKGESSVGKSETALELIQRGHRLVADDAVEIRRIDENQILGKSPEVIRHFMEIRGIGIIDVKSLYGVGATKTTKTIDIIVNLEPWDSNKYYDRLGLDREYENVLDIDIEKLVVPVKPGRNTAMVIEVAAMNFRQRGMGYDAPKEFTQRLSNFIGSK